MSVRAPSASTGVDDALRFANHRWHGDTGMLWPSKGVETMATRGFKVGDHVRWNSEAGRVSGTITKVITSEIEFKGYKVHASKDEPQYEIKSDKTDHIAMHKGSALTKVSA
jgi:hypothetical protein